jgi:glyceraldehyde 3-phosphate dehydrogenase
MTVKVAINGFGRIGRNVLRAIVESGRTDIEVVAINDLGPVETNAHLLRYDSSTAASRHEVQGRRRHHHRCRRQADQGHRDQGSGNPAACRNGRRHRSGMHRHLHRARQGCPAPEAGAKRVIVSAPADGADLTVVFGVNHNELTKEHLVISNASCTTNCLVPVVKTLDDAVGIDHGFMTTIHSYTGDQPTLDTMHKDLYRARAAALSMIPTSTGAAKAVGLVLPHLKGKLDGTSIRVPTPNVSVVDFKFVAKRDTTVAEINARSRQPPTAPSRASSATPTSRWFRATSTMTAIRRSSPTTRPRFWKASSSVSCPGTTMNGASPTAWPTRPLRWPS